jgi:hypothetical protein
MYLANATRPDISYAVSKLSRFVKNPSDTHWGALEKVMRYLKGTMSYAIHYSGHPKVLEGYSEANGSLMLMSFMPQADICFYLEVVVFPRSLASRLS